MRFSRSRYVTLCQQSLVTAAVLAVGVSAAGIKTLDIEPSPSQLTQERPQGQAPQVGSAALPGARPGAGEDLLAKRDRTPGKAPVAAAPVTPKVREVKVSGIEGRPEAAAQAPTEGEASTHAGARKAPEAEKKNRDDMSLVALSEPEKVRGYATVGVTWKNAAEYAEDEIDIEVRTEKDGRWSAWAPAEYHDDHGPDTAEGNGRPGTDALVVGDVDRVQMRARTTDGTTPPDLKLAVIDPGAGETIKAQPAIDTADLGDAPSAAGTDTGTRARSEEAGADSGDAVDTVSLSAMKVAPKPTIYSRAQWGANEKLRESGLPQYGTIKAGFVHHTVNANNYTAAQVPSLLRGIYAYHTQSRGWRDIGYNFLVDRFGRIWEGRYGGVARAVVGAHTSGYNDVSFAMSAIGNFDIAGAPTKMTDAYARLFAWKLSLHNVRATATGIRLHSRTFRAINGHRDAGSTACPGRYLYAKLNTIRTATQKIQDAAQSAGSTPTPPPTPPPTPAPDPTPSNTFTSPTQLPITWTKQSTSLTFPASTNLTGSKHPDLAVKAKDGTIKLVPTGGQTGFAKAVSTPGKWSTMNLVAAVGDVTGDGKGDVLARLAKDSKTRVYAGDGAGHVATPGTNPTGGFQYANFIVAAGDWNRDGRNDVLMRDKFKRLWMVPGLGNGRFGRGTVLHKAWGGWRSTAVAGDMTGDGRPDLLGIHHTGYIYLVPSTSKGTLSTPVRLRSAGTSYSAILGGAGDMSGDKIGDGVLVSSRTGQVSILPGAGRGALGGQLGWFDDSKGLTRLGAAQMTGSGHPDLVGVNEAGTELVVVPHNGLTNLGTSPASTLKVPGATQVLSVGDWNRDGRGDVITRESSGDVLMLHRGYADGRFARAVNLGKGWKSITHLAPVGDVTGDRNPDLAGRTSDGKTVFYPGDGKYGFLAPRTAPEAMKTFNQIGEGSWNPLITAGAAFLSSDKSFVPLVGDKGGDPAGYDWVIGPGDVDGDGRNDLVARDAAGLLWLLPGTADFHGARRLIGTGFGIYSLGG